MNALKNNPTLPWLEANTLFLTRHGSHAYGTNIETSDEDFKGFAVAPLSYYFGYLKKFDQAESKNPDTTVYELRKFMHLATDCNPNIIEVLWGDESDILICHPLAQRIREQRHLFISKKARHTFSGFALAQLKRIKGHYRWLKNPPKAPPTRADFDLPERTVIPADQLAAATSLIQKQLDRWEWKNLEEIDPAARVLVQNSMAEILAEQQLGADEKFFAAGRIVGLDENFLALLDRERHYNAAHREWELYQNWQKSRNPARAELEAKFGYDTKHGMHLVRLMRMCREILETGQVIVKRPDREELLAIRSGLWEYDRLIEWAAQQDQEMEVLYKSSNLRREPDRVAVDALCVEVIQEFLELR